MDYSKELREYCKNEFTDKNNSLNTEFLKNINELKSEGFTSLWKTSLCNQFDTPNQKKALNFHALKFLHSLFFHFSFPISNTTASNPLYIRCFKEIFPFDLSSESQKDLITFNKLKSYFKAQISIELLHSPAGDIPVIKTRHRSDFEYLVRALALKNREKPIPASMGAAMIKGLKSIHKDKAPVTHRVILISNGPYSNISVSSLNPANSLNIVENNWPEQSILIRTAHEATHYVTQRLFNHSTNNIHDELIADYFGIIHASGDYRPEWFHAFAGVDSNGFFKPGGRLANYKKPFELSQTAFAELCRTIPFITENLKKFDTSIKKQYEASTEDFGLFGKYGPAVVTTLCSFTPLEMADPKAYKIMTKKFINLLNT